MADCNNAAGAYQGEGGKLSIEIGPMTAAACPPESRSEQFLKLLSGGARYFFRDGNLYIDLFADGGTMIFAPAAPSTAAASPEAGASAYGAWGFDLTGMDQSVKPGDDFFRYANGAWADRTTIPPDKTRITSFGVLADRADSQLRTIIEGAAADQTAPAGSNLQKIGDWYTAFMDEAGIEKAGLAPLQPELDRIAAISSPADLARVLGEYNGALAGTPLYADVRQDQQDPSKLIVALAVSDYSWLSLETPSYYLDPAQAGLLEQHRAHIARMLTLAGIAEPEATAATIQALETKIAGTFAPQGGSVAAATNNLTPVAELAERYPGVDWPTYLAAAGVDGEATVNVESPAQLAAFARLVADEPLAVWQAYLTYHALKAAAPYLPRAFIEERFAFYGKTLQGQPEPTARAQLAVDDVKDALPFALGEIYVERYVDPATKAAAEAMVAKIVAVFDARLAELPWMTPATRAEARAKLAKTTWKIGYPDVWPSSAGLEVAPGEALGNAQRSQQFRRANLLATLGKPFDRNAWGERNWVFVVNATATPISNEGLVFAAILQPPFFDPKADPAVNYGGIGAVIAHEIGHLFDQVGRQFDGDGRVRDWWTPEDAAQYETLTDKLAAQVSTYEVLPGQFVDGKATIYETVPDISGIAVAYDAYQRSLKGVEPPVLDGFSGDQRFFLAWAQDWRAKTATR